MRIAPCLFAVCFLVGDGALGVHQPARADAESAQAAYSAGQGALARKEWAIAQTEFQRAIEQDNSLVEAWSGLGCAHLGAGKLDEGVAALRTALERLAALAPLGAGRLEAYTTAQTRLHEVSREDGALSALARKHSDVLVGISKKYAAKDADAALHALRQAVRLAPDNRKAVEGLDQVVDAFRGKAEPLLTSPVKGGWTWLSPPSWRYEEGLIAGNVENASMIVKHQRKWQGDYDVVMDARIVDTHPKAGAPYFALVPAWNKDEPTLVFGILRGHFYFAERIKPDDADTTTIYDGPYSDSDPGFDPKVWNAFEVRLREKSISVHVNGKELARAERPRDRTGGHVCLKVQNCHVEFRRVEVTPR